MKTKLSDLNEHLFGQLERLNDTDLKGENLMSEISRSKAITDVSKEIISTHRLVLDAHLKSNDMVINKPIPKMLDSI